MLLECSGHLQRFSSIHWIHLGILHLLTVSLSSDTRQLLVPGIVRQMYFVMKEAELGWGQSQLFALSSLDGGVVGERWSYKVIPLCGCGL